ncbi:Alpha/Beta hydrolase protein [Absidia repens]|uniref:Alpha/Beta hydrolase protein n=1 Tax=Absidia repens TaxID=90262 RepID=A0A1X2IXQ4_9FUNG|nr:Alpha/Beta hydrolase protein [Absidia repens]
MFDLNLPPWLICSLLYVALVIAFGIFWPYIFQCQLIYSSWYPPGSRTKIAKPSDFGINYTEEVLTTKDGIKLRCYVITLDDIIEAKQAATILYFHAGTGNMGDRLPLVKVFNQKLGANVVMLSYRGYGFSEGKADEKGLRLDSQTLLDFVKEHDILQHTNLVAFGHALGGAVAIDLVSRNNSDFAGLILENTFLSIPKVISNIAPWLSYLTLLWHQKWPSETSIQNIINLPVLFISGAKDELVPIAHMKKLYQLCGSRQDRCWVEFATGSHNDTCLVPGYFDAIDDFVKGKILISQHWVHGGFMLDLLQVERLDSSSSSLQDTSDLYHRLLQHGPVEEQQLALEQLYDDETLYLTD